MHTKKLTALSLLCALALVLGFFESYLPVFSVVPGGKIGLANIVTMVVFCLFSLPEAIGFGLFRSLLTSVLFSGFSAFFYSAAGSLFSVLSMWIAHKVLRERVSVIGLSIIGAASFHVGQLTVASFILGSIQIFRYFPVLGILSAFAGLITGVISHMLLRYTDRKKIQNYDKTENGENSLWK